MSHICFHSKNHGNAYVAGSERYHFANGIDHCFVWSLGLHCWPDFSTHPLKQFFPEWVKTSEEARSSLSGAVTSTLAGHDLFLLKINTAMRLAAGPDHELAVLIHATCETHGWFHPDDFQWLSLAIKQGLANGFYRQDQGWDDVLSLIDCADSPIVMSYSVTDGFNASQWDVEFPRIEHQRITQEIKVFGDEPLVGWELMGQFIDSTQE